MARWLLVLILTVAVGVGVVGACPEGRCPGDARATSGLGDDCAGEDGEDGEDHGEEREGDECPPFCGGCSRVTADAPLQLSLTTVALAAAQVPDVVPPTPVTAPPLQGVFRPPRA